MPRLTHPDIGVTVEVSEGKARVLAKSGWVDADAAPAAPEPPRLDPPVTGATPTPESEED